jgi:uncharacterized metal-binding protein YceD (DUF177 family)
MDIFTIKLGSITNGENSFSYVIKDQFFEEFDFAEVKHSDIFVKVVINKKSEKISLNLIINGQINQIPCDICTDNISVNINGETNVIIQKTDDDLISTDEILYIKSSENKLNLKQLIFESIILNVPKIRQHPLDTNGKITCNKEMVDLVKKYTQVIKKASDPRWDALKNLTK